MSIEIDGELYRTLTSFRHDPNAEWTPFTLEEMAKKWEQQKREFEVRQQAVVRAMGMGYLL